MSSLEKILEDIVNNMQEDDIARTEQDHSVHRSINGFSKHKIYEKNQKNNVLIENKESYDDNKLKNSLYDTVVDNSKNLKPINQNKVEQEQHLNQEPLDFQTHQKNNLLKNIDIKDNQSVNYENQSSVCFNSIIKNAILDWIQTPVGQKTIESILAQIINEKLNIPVDYITEKMNAKFSDQNIDKIVTKTLTDILKASL